MRILNHQTLGLAIPSSGIQALNKQYFGSPSGSYIEPHELALVGRVSREQALALQMIVAQRGLGVLRLRMYHDCYDEPVASFRYEDFPPGSPFICPYCGESIEEPEHQPLEPALVVHEPFVVT